MRRRAAYIVAAYRTPIGTYNGSLASFTAPQLGIISSNACFDRVNVPRESVDEVIFGNVLSANLGQNPCRQVSMGCNLPNTSPCTTINKVCSSGLKSVALASQSIELGHSNIILCGGMESMSNAPYYSTHLRFGKRMGNSELIDGMIRDGLSDPWTGEHMGNIGDYTSVLHDVSRSELDDYSVESFKRAQKAYELSLFDSELVNVKIINKKGGNDTIISKDEGCFKFDENKLRSLNGAFDGINGTTTAGNSSQISDGSSSLLLCSEEIIKDLNLKPMAKILSYADAEQEPKLFPSTPSLSIPLALKRAGLALNDINNSDFFEINEAFAVVALINMKILNISHFNCNLYGGAVALGHPIGCSGARILTTLLSVLKENSGRYGICGICNGGGGATSLVVENLR